MLSRSCGRLLLWLQYEGSNPPAHMILAAGMCSSSIAQFAAYPLALTRTRLQVGRPPAEQECMPQGHAAVALTTAAASMCRCGMSWHVLATSHAALPAANADAAGPLLLPPLPQAQGIGGRPIKYSGMLDVLRKTVQNEGVRGLYKVRRPTAALERDRP